MYYSRRTGPTTSSRCHIFRTLASRLLRAGSSARASQPAPPLYGCAPLLLPQVISTVTHLLGTQHRQPTTQASGLLTRNALRDALSALAAEPSDGAAAPEPRPLSGVARQAGPAASAGCRGGQAAARLVPADAPPAARLNAIACAAVGLSSCSLCVVVRHAAGPCARRAAARAAAAAGGGMRRPPPPAATGLGQRAAAAVAAPAGDGGVFRLRRGAHGAGEPRRLLADQASGLGGQTDPAAAAGDPRRA